MFRIIIIIALVFTIGCAGSVDPDPETGEIIETTQSDTNTTEPVQEVAETRSELQILFTECEQGNTIDLIYDDIVIVSATHWVHDRRQVVDAWFKDEPTGLVGVSHCEKAVQIVYLYR